MAWLYNQKKVNIPDCSFLLATGNYYIEKEKLCQQDTNNTNYTL